MLTLRKGQLMCAGDPFHADNRMGLTGTLHRISAIRDRDGSVIGITYRIGRHMPGQFVVISHLMATLSACGRVCCCFPPMLVQHVLT